MFDKKLLIASLLTLATTGSWAADTCLSCHETHPDTANMTPAQIHASHLGLSAQPEANCFQCHQDAPEDKVFSAKLNACEGCHTNLGEGKTHSKVANFSQTDCTACHSEMLTRSVHRGKFEKAVAEGQMEIASVDVTDAKLVEVEGKTFADVSFRLLNNRGEAIAVENNDPADADWIKNLQLYINWGASVDFLSPRGYSLFVKSNKRDITQKGEGKTPAGERERTPLFKAENNVFTYRLGPVVTEDAISGNKREDLGVVSDRFIYCFNSKNELMSCDLKGHRKNAAWNHVWYFDKNGLVDKTAGMAARPEIVSNAKCGSCHGYFPEHEVTNVECRNCHSRNAEKNKRLADTTCFSGHDDKDGLHTAPRMEKALKKRALAGFGGSTKDLTLPCVVCHNPNTPPTAAIRERFAVAGEEHFIEDLILSSPDHKMWMHTLHSNTRPTARGKNSVRHVEYSADLNNCTRCHVGESYSIDRLAKEGRPIALDTAYDPDSSAHPAIDFKVNAYASPIAATCFGCHAMKTDENGRQVRNDALLEHIEIGGGKFGVPLEELGKEMCATCHTTENLKEVHKLK